MNLKICWLVIWLVACNPMTESRETVTAGWIGYFRHRTQEPEEMHNVRELCPLELSCAIQTCIKFCKLSPRKAFYSQKQQAECNQSRVSRSVLPPVMKQCPWKIKPPISECAKNHNKSKLSVPYAVSEFHNV